MNYIVFRLLKLLRVFNGGIPTVAEVEHILAHSQPRVSKIIMLYAMEYVEEGTLEAAGVYYGVSRERVRQCIIKLGRVVDRNKDCWY